LVPSVSNLELLARVPLFVGLPDQHLADLGACLRSRQYRPGERVFMQGDPGAALYIVASGQVKLAVSSAEGREMIIDLFGPADFFGELSLLDGEPRSADAWAMEPSVLLLLERDAFRGFMRERPAVMEHLLMVLSKRLRRDAAIIQDAAFLDVPARLARAILRLSEPAAGAPANGSTTPRLSQTDLAGVVGTTRETLNKWLGIYEDQGLIRREKRRIAVLRPEGLRKRGY
jgi:CRP-like cAMP-binding protein